MKTKILEQEDIKEIREILLNNGVVAFPTETVYGLAIRSDSFLAYTNIFEAKMRPESKVLTLMLTNPKDIELYAQVFDATKRVINAFMPGELTVVLPVKSGVNLCGIEDTVGIRIPDNQITLALLNGIGLPLFVTSANISSQPPATSFNEVVTQLDGRIDAIVQGATTGGTPSTVVSIIDGAIKLIRAGNISLEELEGVYKQ